MGKQFHPKKPNSTELCLLWSLTCSTPFQKLPIYLSALLFILCKLLVKNWNCQSNTLNIALVVMQVSFRTGFAHFLQ